MKILGLSLNALCIIVLLLFFILVYDPLLLPLDKLGLLETASIDIISGEDGPEAIFATIKPTFIDSEYFLLFPYLLVIATLILNFLILLFSCNKNNSSCS